ncbi:MAG: peptidoglycan bridge formation glycyltransferase FemA/FemB family protein [Thermomicrobiales bacterium]|nr:peptidoglycan bridge formation glycyltransferase FemA/FemB family protein [Thermomicrobiales bacterium]
MSVALEHPAIATDSDAARWDADVLRFGGHFLQSWRWGEFKTRHGWDVVRVRTEGSQGVGMAQILFKRRGPLGLAYVPRGPVLSADEPALLAELMAEIDRACRRRRAISIVLEPNRALPMGGIGAVAGLMRGPAHIQPARTVKVPLLADEPLLMQMHQKTRYNVRLAHRKGVIAGVEAPSEETFAAFFSLMQDTSQRNEFGIHADDYYRDALTIFGSDIGLLMARDAAGTPVATAIVARFGPEAIYLYGASSTLHRSLGAGFALQYRAMRWARDRGAEAYDLWGIPAKTPESTRLESGDGVAGTRGDDWRGLYEFKVRFGGRIITYPPTLERGYLPLLPTLARRVYGVQG